MNSRGLTLIEILVALTVLAIGAAGLAGLQLATLKLAHQTGNSARLLHVAENELQSRLLGVGSGPACSAVTADELTGIHCQVTETGCTLTIDGFDCSGPVAGLPRQVSVTATLAQASGNEAPSVTLSAVTRSWAAP